MLQLVSRRIISVIMTEKPVYKRGGGFLLEETPVQEAFTPEDFTDEHKMLARSADEFMEREVLPNTERIEAQDFELLRSLMKKAGELGLLAADVPEKYGGLELDKVSSMLIAEKMSKQGSFSVTWGAHTGIGTLPIVFFGNEEQKQKYLPGLATGELIGAYALTEPNAGSDAMNIKTKATLSDDGKYYILNGNKQFITNTAIADVFTVFAKVDGEKFTAFIVERDTPGMEFGPEEKKMGIKGSSTRAITFDNAKVPVENVLGEIGKGHHIAFGILNIGRYKLGVGAVGAAKYALQTAVKYAKERVQFGQPIANFGLIKEKLANMTLRLFVTESMVYRLAGLLDEAMEELNPEDPDYHRKAWDAVAEYAVESSIVKVFGSEMLDYVVDETVQIFGGYGFISEYPAERFYRDSRINRIFEGTNEINRLLIPGMLMRRAMKGLIPLVPVAAKVAKETVTLMPTMLPRPEGPLSEPRFALQMAKRIALTIAAVAADRFRENIRDEQEVLGGLADIVTAVYGLESVLLRALKSGDSMMHSLVELYAYDAMKHIERRAYDFLPYMAEGDELKTLISTVRKLTRPFTPPNAVIIRRSVADKVIETGKYPFTE